MFKKKFLKTKCKVTFELPEQLTEGAEEVFLVGDFNNWDERALKMEKKKGNRFTLDVDLDLGKEYQYRFLINGTNWQNDWDADKYVPNPFWGDNSVISTVDSGQSSANGASDPASKPAKQARKPASKSASKIAKPKTSE